MCRILTKQSEKRVLMILHRCETECQHSDGKTQRYFDVTDLRWNLFISLANGDMKTTKRKQVRTTDAKKLEQCLPFKSPNMTSYLTYLDMTSIFRMDFKILDFKTVRFDLDQSDS